MNHSELKESPFSSDCSESDSTGSDETNVRILPARHLLIGEYYVIQYGTSNNRSTSVVRILEKQKQLVTVKFFQRNGDYTVTKDTSYDAMVFYDSFIMYLSVRKENEKTITFHEKISRVTK